MKFPLIIIAAIIFLCSLSIIPEAHSAPKKENIEIIVNTSEGYKKAWSKMVKNPKIKEILQRAKLYVLYEGDPMSEQVLKNSLAANSNLYLASLGSQNGQFDLINLGYLAQDESRHATKINEIKQNSFNYLGTRKKNEQEKIISSSINHHNRMLKLIYDLARQTKSADEFDKLFSGWTDKGQPQLIFVNGKFTPNFFDNYISKIKNPNLGKLGDYLIETLSKPKQGM